MNETETAAILAVAALYDNRSLTEETVIAWHATLEDLDFTQAKNAVVEYYRRSDKYLMPAHIRELVKTQAERDVVNERRQAALRPRLALAGTADGRYGQRRIAEPSPWYVQAKATLEALRSAHSGSTAGGSL